MIQYNYTWASHIPLLIKVMEQSEGPVLELGSGLFSTPLLYWMCYDQDREFETYDNEQRFVDMMRKFGVKKADDWAQLPIDRRWGMVFIDHHPSLRRGIDAIRFAQLADYVVLHDTNDEEGHNYTDVFPHFKYRYDWKKTKPYTTVLSNFKELNFE